MAWLLSLLACASPNEEGGALWSQLGVSEVAWEVAQTLSPLPEPELDPTNAVEADPKAALLGQWIFFDPRFSADGVGRCADCHDPERGFANRERVSTDGRHTPSLLNAAQHRWFFWDGRCDTLWCAAAHELQGPMGMEPEALASLVAGDPELSGAYQAIFGEIPGDALALTADLGKALAAYLRLLSSGDSALDRFVEAVAAEDAEAADFPEEAIRGLDLFAETYGCTTCHHSPFLTDREFHNSGVGARDWLPIDTGRYDGILRLLADPLNAAGPYSDDPASGDDLDRLVLGTEQLGQFRTPSLRGVSETPPYYHGGHFETVREVLEFDATLEEVAPIGHREEWLQPAGFTEEDMDELEAFLGQLAGEPPGEALRGAPASPVEAR